MKKTEPKKKTEKMTLEKLALMVAQGFESMIANMVSKDEFNSEIALLKQGQAKLEQGQEAIKEDISSIKEEQKETNRCVHALTKKQSGMLFSLDETVHRSEFDQLAHRVEVLES